MKKLILLILAVLLIFSGCGENKNLGFDISSGVHSFDPQLAKSDSELIIIKNCFQGLLDKDENGALIPGIAESYEISENGLEYTFHIKENLFWNDGETPITANDFVFGFKRLFSPETSAPSRSDFYNILNSEDIANGNNASKKLGVAAIDNYTLKITLEHEDPLFPDLLTNAAAMPCNEEFFKSTKGRYGLGLSYTLFNGAYYIRRIFNSSYVLSPNEQSDIANTTYKNIYLFVKDNPKAEAVSRLSDNTVDAAVINFSDKQELIENGFSINESENTVWMLAFNTKNENLSNKKIRKAIAYSIDKAPLKDKVESNYRIAESYVPESVTLNGNSYRKAVGESFSGFEYDAKMASDLLKSGREELDISRLSSLTIICTEEFIPAMGFVQKSIQNNLDIFVNLIPMSDSELSSAVSSGNYDLALVSLTPQYDNPNAVFSFFTNSNNYCGYANPDFNEAVSNASHLYSYDEMADGYSVAEQMLLQDMPALPLFYETSYFATSPNISGINYSVFGGHIVFRFCK